MTSITPYEGRAPLPHWGLIRARGDDAATFLQGQLTNDVAGMKPGEARLSGYCSAKGRLLASFVVWRLAADEFLLACSADLLAPTLKRLSMFVLRAKCKLDEASGDWRVEGWAGTAASTLLGDAAPAQAWVTVAHAGGQVSRLPDAANTARYLCLLPSAAEPAALPALSSQTWRWLDVQSGVPFIEAATVEQFVPQMVNLELVGGVSFKKGCYPGQEVVARSQYRGTLKRRTALFDVDAPAQAGQEVFLETDPQQPAGMVVNAAPNPAGGTSALIEVKLAALEAGPLHLGAPDGSVLTRRSLPYSLPSDAAASDAA